MPRNNTIKHFANSTEYRTKNRRFTIIKPVKSKDDLTLMENQNLIHIKAMVSDVGPKPGVIHKLTHNNKVKESIIGLSDQAMFELYVGLNEYYKNQVNLRIQNNIKNTEEDAKS